MINVTLGRFAAARAWPRADDRARTLAQRHEITRRLRHGDGAAREDSTLKAITIAPAATVTSIQPVDGGAIVYEPLARRSANHAADAQLSIDVVVKNDHGSPISVDEVRLSYDGVVALPSVTLEADVQSTVPARASFDLVDDRGIEPNQSCRLILTPDQKLPIPAPTQITIRVFFVGYGDPVTLTAPLLAHQNAPTEGSYRFPANAMDLPTGQYWSSRSSGVGSHHCTSSSQLYAYDAGLYAPETLQRVAARLDDWTASFEAARRQACESGWFQRETPVERFSAQLSCLEDRAREARALVNRQAVEIARAAAGAAHPNVGVCHRNLGNDYLYGLQPELAIVELEKAAAILEAAHGPKHRDVALSLTDLGLALIEAGQYERATTTFERAAELWQSVGPKHPAYAEALFGQYLALEALGRPTSVADLETAVTLGQQLPPFLRARIQLVLGHLSSGSRATELVAAAVEGFASSSLPLIQRELAQAKQWQREHGIAP